MRRHLLLTVLLGCGVAAAAPIARSAIIRHESVGPLSLQVRSATPLVMQGGNGSSDLLIGNSSTTATIIVEIDGELRFANGATQNLSIIRLRLDPGMSARAGYSYWISGSAAVGPARILVGARVLEIHEAGTVSEPAEPTGCWDSDGFTVI